MSAGPRSRTQAAVQPTTHDRLATASPAAVLDELGATLDGLGHEAAEFRLRTDGRNVLPVPRGPGHLWMAGRQLVHFFALMLWAASALAFVAQMPELGWAIVAVIAVNAAFSFAQEYRAERAVRALAALLPTAARVVRDRRQTTISAEEVVRGDVLVLREGDHVPADARVLRSDGVTVDESPLTGESVPVSKSPEQPAEPTDGMYRPTLVFAGTYVASGSCLAVAVATGAATQLGQISRLAGSISRPRTPLQRELNRSVLVIAGFAVAVGTTFLAVSLLMGTPLRLGLLFAIGVLVALVPEGLLPTLTLALATSAARLARERVLVRRLEAVETLGSTTVICTDKTGTLTTNQMTVRTVLTRGHLLQVTGVGYGDGGALLDAGRPLTDEELLAARPLLLAAALCGNARIEQDGGRARCVGDPTEGALVVLAAKGGVASEAAERRLPRLREYGFDSLRRRMSTLHATPAGDLLILSKGSPEAILEVCSTILADDGERPLDARATARVLADVDGLAAEGLRVLALASRTLSGPAPEAAAQAERDMRLLGLVGLADPVRPQVPDAVERCRRAGIRIVMITGDHPATAVAVARRAGLDTAPVLLGSELLDGERELAQVLGEAAILARMAPEQKLMVTEMLQRQGHVVAMTGDGVNDAPALRRADIGVAMGATGTDVARSAADMVLLDDDFSHLVRAVEEGRATFANIRKFLTYHLTDNVAELTPFVAWAVSLGSIPLAISVLQVLALDIGTDVFPALALGIEPAQKHVMSQPPRSARSRLLNRGVLARAFGFLGPVEAAVSMSVMLLGAALFLGWRPGLSLPGSGPGLQLMSGLLFASIVLLQMVNAFECRSPSASVFTTSPLSNRLLLAAVATGLGLLAMLLYVPFFAQMLGQRPLTAEQWLPVLAAPFVLLAAEEARKYVARRARHGVG